MKTFRRKLVESKLRKAGFPLDEMGNVTVGELKLEVRESLGYGCKGDTCHLRIRDLKDPDRAEVDHFTTIYPWTIKSAISFLRGEAEREASRMSRIDNNPPNAYEPEECV